MSINLVFQPYSVVDVRNPFKITCLSFTKHEKYVGLYVSLPPRIHGSTFSIAPQRTANIRLRAKQWFTVLQPKIAARGEVSESPSLLYRGSIANNFAMRSVIRQSGYTGSIDALYSTSKGSE